jgi:hypothetical protein
LINVIFNKNIITMNVENKIKDILELLDDAIAFEDFRRVDDARKELTFLYEQMESTFPLDGWDDNDVD